MQNVQANFEDITRARELFSGSAEMNKALDGYLSPLPTRAELFKIAQNIKDGVLPHDAPPQTLSEQVRALEAEHAALTVENQSLRDEVKRLKDELESERNKAGFGTGLIVGSLLG
ncbi:hypothetical protein PSP6_690118 [Paraburkholderia tropica]|uniref:hypothetical protein n=1 Tax=Paraburkholderia tropica TaxID=92647 RepID=UPI001CAC7079|nr:hypothetical protein [Paraburkholderia tropica]CAG9235992.1 hypothetical protein PSP6_690118 [Paraburkholderia tropica]